MREVRAHAESQVKEIRQRSARDAENIKAEAQKESSAILAKESEAAEREVDRERMRLMASAKLEAKKIVLESQEKRLDGGMDLLLQRLKAFTATPEYAKLLDRMAQTGISLLGDGTKLLVRKDDVSKISISYVSRVSKDKPLNALGGLIAESQDGKRRISMTFEELLRWKEDRIRELLSRK